MNWNTSPSRIRPRESPHLDVATRSERVTEGYPCFVRCRHRPRSAAGARGSHRSPFKGWGRRSLVRGDRRRHVRAPREGAGAALLSEPANLIAWFAAPHAVRPATTGCTSSPLRRERYAAQYVENPARWRWLAASTTARAAIDDVGRVPSPTASSPLMSTSMAVARSAGSSARCPSLPCLAVVVGEIDGARRDIDGPEDDRQAEPARPHGAGVEHGETSVSCDERHV